MVTEVRSPVFPESVSDGVIAAWHKQVGEAVEQDENLVDIETDKVVLEVPAPESGVLKEIILTEGDTVEAQVVMAIIDSAATAAPQKVATNVETESTAPDAVAVNTEAAVSPAARKLIAEKGLDAAHITGSGKGGLITKEDVMNFSGQQEAAKSNVAPLPTSNAPAQQVETAVTIEGSRAEKRVPMTRLRARIAERLVDAQQTAAMLTTFNEVNLAEVKSIRARYKDAFEKQHGVKLGFMSFFVKAAVEALKKFPEVNASIDGNDIVYHGFCDIGVAVSSPRGLVVPIIRNAEELSLAEIEQSILDYSTKARDGKLSIDEMTGGTFTISNGGVFGSLLSTPILNPPQSAILGMHAIQERPVVEKGEIVIRPMMNLAVSYDHRIIDGKEAVSFLVTIKQLLEDPNRLLLEV